MLASDGVVGLAFAGMSKIAHPTFLEAAAASIPELSLVFAFHLAHGEEASEFHFGGYDLSVAGEATLARFPVLKLPRRIIPVLESCKAGCGLTIYACMFASSLVTANLLDPCRERLSFRPQSRFGKRGQPV
jgi:hypothetical protein